jgi:hypothetical protein
MFRQVGQTFSGVVLTSDKYKRVEDAYIQTALSFLGESGLYSMKVAGPENPRKRSLDFQNGSVLTPEHVEGVIRQILREEFWCRLDASDGYLHFGLDYYMYVGVPHPCPAARTKASESAYMSRNLDPPYVDNMAES